MNGRKLFLDPPPPGDRLSSRGRMEIDLDVSQVLFEMTWIWRSCVCQRLLFFKLGSFKQKRQLVQFGAKWWSSAPVGLRKFWSCYAMLWMDWIVSSITLKVARWNNPELRKPQFAAENVKEIGYQYATLSSPLKLSDSISERPTPPVLWHYLKARHFASALPFRKPLDPVPPPLPEHGCR